MFLKRCYILIIAITAVFQFDAHTIKLKKSINFIRKCSNFLFTRLSSTWSSQTLLQSFSLKPIVRWKITISLISDPWGHLPAKLKVYLISAWTHICPIMPIPIYLYIHWGVLNQKRLYNTWENGRQSGSIQGRSGLIP